MSENTKTYSIDNLFKWRRLHGLPIDDYSSSANIRAVKSDEFREPKKDEWFISGAIPCAYHAKHDMTRKHWIAKFVIRKTKEVFTIHLF